MTDARSVLALTGADRTTFLQNLVTNDVQQDSGTLVYTALLTPQGKFIADFFVVTEDDRLLIDVAQSHAAPLKQRLNMYKLRADVTITKTDLTVSCGTGTPPEDALPDPRHAALGWRAYGDNIQSDETDWAALYVAHMIPRSGIELTPDTYILEAGFERLNGIDFRKGCYVGQEIAARMKHKTTLKKGLAQVRIAGKAEPGTAITNRDKPAGTLYSVSGDLGLAYLRFDRTDEMRAGDATLTLVKTATTA